MESRNISLARYDLLELYMIFGGVPFYWSLIEQGSSVAQNIDRLVFARNGKLHNEYNELYDSLFKSPEVYVRVIKALSEGPGHNREELVSLCGLDGNGKTTRILDDLQECGFIRKIPTYDLKNHGIYKLTDNFTLFFEKFVRDTETDDEHFWSHSYLSPLHNAWVGLAFERVCFQHINQIKQALGISGVITTVYSWRTGPSEPGAGDGAQIDMLIDRADNMVNICEMKFSKDEYVITYDDHQKIVRRSVRFSAHIKHKKSINITLVTANGLSKTGHWNDAHNIITSEDLFNE